MFNTKIFDEKIFLIVAITQELTQQNYLLQKTINYQQNKYKIIGGRNE